MARENEHLDDSQIESLREELLSKKEQLLHKEIKNEKYCLNTNELSDPLDEANINLQASQELRLRNRENFFLKKILLALEKIKSGSYGLCSDCGLTIPYERLMARTTAELCIVCKEDMEINENNNFFHKKSKSLGRTIQEI